MNIIVSPPYNMASNRAANVAQNQFPLWQRLLNMGDRLAGRGETLSSYQRSQIERGRAPCIDEQIEILGILLEAEKAIKKWTEIQVLRQPTPDPEHRGLTLASLQLRAATLHFQDGFIGDRKKAKFEAELSGLTRDVHEMIDEFESQISVHRITG